MARTMTPEAAWKKFLQTFEFRQVPGDEQQIEYRRGDDEDWKPFAFYGTVEIANAKFAGLLQEQREVQP